MAIINDDLIGKTMLLSLLSISVSGAIAGAILSVPFTVVVSSSTEPLINDILQDMGLWATVGILIGALTGVVLINK